MSSDALPIHARSELGWHQRGCRREVVEGTIRVESARDQVGVVEQRPFLAEDVEAIALVECGRHYMTAFTATRGHGLFASSREIDDAAARAALTFLEDGADPTVVESYGV